MILSKLPITICMTALVLIAVPSSNYAGILKNGSALTTNSAAVRKSIEDFKAHALTANTASSASAAITVEDIKSINDQYRKIAEARGTKLVTTRDDEKTVTLNLTGGAGSLGNLITAKKEIEASIKAENKYVILANVISNATAQIKIAHRPANP